MYYLGQFSSAKTHHRLDRATCDVLKAEGKGEYINRNTAFRRWDVMEPQADNKEYKSSGRHGESLKIDEPIPIPGEVMMNGMMTRYVLGDPYARAAVNSWRR